MHGPHGHSNPRQQLAMSLMLLVLLLILGWAGFYILDDERDLFDALWVTANVLTTVGDAGEEYSRLEKLWGIFLMFSGIAAALYAGGNLAAFIIDGELRRLFGKRRLETRIKQLHNHFVICGFGRMGSALCEALSERGVPFILIDRDTEGTAEADQLNYLYLQGDAMSEAMLEKASIKDAAGLASCLDSDADNVFVTLSARSLNEKMTIISRAEETATEHKLRRAGADRVICPAVLTAKHVAAMLIQPTIDELLDVQVGTADIEVTKFKGEQLPGLVNIALKDSQIPNRTGLLVALAVRPDGSRKFNPPPDFTPSNDDELIVIGPKGGSDKLLEMFGSGKKH